MILANKLFVSSDFFILTSLWEPCGLTDFEAQIAGSLPIVHKTGGLQKVINNVTGFVYDDFDKLCDILLKCEDLYYSSPINIEQIKKKAYMLIRDNYTWEKVVENRYIPLFKGMD